MSISQDLPLLLHAHIPKTAGTSLRGFVFNSLGGESCLNFESSNPYSLEISTREFSDAISLRPEVKFVSGHFPYGIHRCLPKRACKYITILRDPASRALSLYRHHLVRNFHRIDKHEREMVALGFFPYLLSPYGRITLMNTQCRMIMAPYVKSSSLHDLPLAELAELACDIVNKDFLCVGYDQNFRETLDTVASFFSFERELGGDFRLNVGGSFAASTILPQTHLSALMALNSYDCVLVKSLCGIDCLDIRSSVDDEATLSGFNYQALLDSSIEMLRQIRIRDGLSEWKARPALVDAAMYISDLF